MVLLVEWPQFVRIFIIWPNAESLFTAPLLIMHRICKSVSKFCNPNISINISSKNKCPQHQYFGHSKRTFLSSKVLIHLTHDMPTLSCDAKIIGQLVVWLRQKVNFRKTPNSKIKSLFLLRSLSCQLDRQSKINKLLQWLSKINNCLMTESEQCLLFEISSFGHLDPIRIKCKKGTYHRSIGINSNRFRFVVTATFARVEIRFSLLAQDCVHVTDDSIESSEEENSISLQKTIKGKSRNLMQARQNGHLDFGNAHNKQNVIMGRTRRAHLSMPVVIFCSRSLAAALFLAAQSRCVSELQRNRKDEIGIRKHNDARGQKKSREWNIEISGHRKLF